MSSFPASRPASFPASRAAISRRMAAFAPTKIDNLILWLAADSGDLLQASGGSAADADGDPVGVWPDQSGSGNNATQATAANKPTFRTNTLNGKPVVDGDQTDDVMNVTTGVNWAGSTTWHAFAVIVNANNGPSTEHILGTAVDTGWHMDKISDGASDRPLRIGIDDGVSRAGVNSTSTIHDDPHVVEMVNTGSQVEAIIDGASEGTAAHGDVVDVGDLADGITLFDASDNANPSGMGVAEVLLYNAVITANEIRSVRTYLLNKYGIKLA